MNARTLAVLALIATAVSPIGAQQPDSIAGWRCFGTCARDTLIRHGGLASAMVSSSSEGGAGTLNQSMKPDAFRGKRVRYSAWVKTDSITSAAGAGLWMRVDGTGVGATLQFDNMFNRPIPALGDWTRHEIVLDVPEESSFLIWGLIVNGRGRAWIDDIRIEVVDQAIPSTHKAGSERHATHDVTAERIAATMRARESAPSSPTNLDFERRP